MSKKSYIIVAIVVVVLISGLTAVGLTTRNKVDNGLYDAFAKCLGQKGLVFYGAFWCPHCRAQKAEFGDATQYLPYHECSTPDASGELQDCKDLKIDSFPTWVYPDGTRTTGEQPLDALAAKSGCMLPGTASSTVSSSTSQS